MKITLNNYCASFKEEKSAVNHPAWAAFCLILLIGHAKAFAATDYASLPSVAVTPVQKSENGNKYKIGARIPVMIPLPKDLNNPGTLQFNLNVPEGSSATEDQGWYIDPEISVSNGNLLVVVSPIQGGQLILPQLIVSKILDKSSTPIERTETWTIEVEAPTPDPKTATEYLSPIDVSLTTRVWLMLLLGATLAIGLTLFALRKYLKVQPKITSQPVIATESESESLIAYRKLRALFAENPFIFSKLKPIAFGTSEIMKEYFSVRFNVDAQEATTSELFALLTKAGIAKHELKDVENLYSDLDLIKFTKPDAYTHFNEESYQSIRIRAEALVARWGTKK